MIQLNFYCIVFFHVLEGQYVIKIKIKKIYKILNLDGVRNENKLLFLHSILKFYSQQRSTANVCLQIKFETKNNVPVFS